MILLSDKIFAQGTVDPRAFPDSNFSWNETYDYIDYEFDDYDSYKITYYDAGDTIVNGTHYRKLNIIKVYIDYDWMTTWPNSPYIVSIHNSNELFAFIRNDKVNKKVYLLYEWETEEIILYDFGLKYKDKVTMNYFNETIFNNVYVVKVDSLIDPDGIKRNYFVYSSNLADTAFSSFPFYSRFIEGIGTTIGIYTKLINLPYERVFPKLKCIKLDINKTYSVNENSGTGSGNDLNKVDSCNFTKFQFMSVENISSKSFSLYPNPTENLIHFNIDDEIELLEIFDSKLSLIKCSTKLRNKFLEISQLPSGIYFCKVYSKGKYYSAKFLKK